jgi:hypothetical protein
MLMFKSIIAGAIAAIAALLLLVVIFLFAVRRSGMFGVGPLRLLAIWVGLYLLAAFLGGFIWMYWRS